MVESLKYCVKEKGLEVYAWCIMSSHVHLIVGAKGEQKLEEIIRDLKRHPSKAILKEIETHPQESRKEWLLWMFERAGRRNSNNKKCQFWQQNNKPIELFSGEMAMQKLNYIHQNPIVARIVREPEQYVYSNAADYAGINGAVPISFLN